MAQEQINSVLWGWEGYQVGLVRRVGAETPGDRTRVLIELRVDRSRPGICGGCGDCVRQVHDYQDRCVRDLPILEGDTYLFIRRRRLACGRCGAKLERLNWLEPYGRVTNRLAEAVARLCKVLPIKHVAEHYSLGWELVKNIDKAWLQKELGPPDLEGVEQIVMDEFAIQKGHRYATVVVDAQTKRVLWVGRGRGREDVRPFFDLLGPDGRAGVRAVGIDMNAAYELEVRQWCPNAQIVYDLFHVVAKYGREVIDRVRVDEANRLREDKKARQVVKGSRWLLLRNRENITRAEDRIRLQELLAANKKLSTVYILKDDLKQLWRYRYPAAALRFWRQWYNRAVRSRIKPLVEFAKKLKGYLDGILAHCRWRIHTSVIEGINNKIKVIKRMAYGYRDDEYFFLKIRAAFPGNP